MVIFIDDTLKEPNRELLLEYNLNNKIVNLSVLTTGKMGVVIDKKTKKEIFLDKIAEKSNIFLIPIH